MSFERLIRAGKLVLSGAVLLQFLGCQGVTLIDVVQTGLLGVTAAGAVAILQNL